MKIEKRPIKVAGYSHAKSDARKAEKRSAAKWRQSQYDKLSGDERALVDARRKREYDAKHRWSLPNGKDEWGFAKILL